jgi:hypothetical protein
MTALVLTASIAISVPVQKDSKELTETNIDYCDPNPCLNGRTCTDGVNSYTCACQEGFERTDCEINIDDWN